MQPQPILIYSKYCKHSLQFIELLENYPHVANALMPLCIDPVLSRPEQSRDPNTNGEPPSEFLELQQFLKETTNTQITSVPTIFYKTENEITLVSGNKAFAWLLANGEKKETAGTLPHARTGSELTRTGSVIDNVGKGPEKVTAKEKTSMQLEGINPNEMMSFSDSYSLLNSDTVSNQSYQFLNTQFQSIQTLEEQAISNKEKFCQDKYEQLLKERERI
jgi:hypothetical protein